MLHEVLSCKFFKWRSILAELVQWVSLVRSLNLGGTGTVALLRGRSRMFKVMALFSCICNERVLKGALRIMVFRFLFFLRLESSKCGSSGEFGERPLVAERVTHIEL